MIQFDVVGDPKGEPRPRARSFNKGGKTITSMYAPKTAHEWKQAVRDAWPEDLTAPVFVAPDPVAVILSFRFQRPLSHYVANDRERPLKDRIPELLGHTSKPDADNLAKAVLDALGPWPKGSDTLAWTDDSQVAELLIMKRYVFAGEQPGCLVTLNPL